MWASRSKLGRLPPSRRRALGWGALWLAAARARLSVPGASLPAVDGDCTRLAARLPLLHELAVADAAWAVAALARRLPGTTCLPYALALRGLLAQAAIPAELCIGVSSENVKGFTAHAWVQCQGRAFSYGDPVDAYERLRPRLERRQRATSQGQPSAFDGVR